MYTACPYVYALVAVQEEVMIRWVYYAIIHQGPGRNITTLPYLQEEKEARKATGSGAAKWSLTGKVSGPSQLGVDLQGHLKY